MKTNGAKLSDPPILPIGEAPAARDPQLHSIPDVAAPPEALRTKTSDPAIGTKHSPQQPVPQQRWPLSLVVLALVAGAGYYFYPQIPALLGAQRTAAPPRDLHAFPARRSPV